MYTSQPVAQTRHKFFSNSGITAFVQRFGKDLGTMLTLGGENSALRDFLASIATIKGDLSNITAPPFVLLDKSTTELPQFWGDHPDLLVAPSKEEEPAKRALQVLRWFLGSLRNQQYAGNTSDSVKKPLNAFLGELFIGAFPDNAAGETKLVSEQVSHHPPVTACYLWNEKHGVRAEGFTCQEITFSGSVNIRQDGYAIFSLDRFDEQYLIPVPNVRVKGILSTPYPELDGRYHLVSSSGYICEIDFEGKGFLGGGNKNSIHATVFEVQNPSRIIYEVTGQWTGTMTVKDVLNDQELEPLTLDLTSERTVNINVAPTSEQDPWESRRAWNGVITAIKAHDMQGISNAKSAIEQAQRNMRKEETARNEKWQTIFFDRYEEDPVHRKLKGILKKNASNGASTPDTAPKGGIWKVNLEKVKSLQRPFHGEMTPMGVREDESKPAVEQKV